MADYDTKSIPILDDIIEIRTIENTTADDGASVDLADETALAESNLDLFFDESGDVISEESDPQLGAIDDIDKGQDYNAQKIDFAATEFSILDEAISDETEVEIDIAEDVSETIESAVIEFEAEAMSSDFDQITFIEPSVDEAGDVPANIPAVIPGETPVETLTLESVVDDILRQLMPDLELQLRFLVQQALEDRLSDEILDRLTTKNNKP